jgi:hypothetical protein
MRSRRGRALGYTVSAASLCALLRATPAWGQTDEDRAGARTLATEGAKAFAAQRWTDAIDLFTRAEALLHAPPHLLYLARARTKIGQFVLARETYTKVIRENIPANAPAAFLEAQTAAKAEMPALEPRIAMLTISVSGADPKTVSVLVDGQKVPSVFVGAPKPVDPGEHKVQAIGEGMASEVLTLHIKEGARENVSLSLSAQKGAMPPATTSPETAPVVPPPGASNRVEMRGSDMAPLPPEGRSNGMRIASFAALGVGAVGLGVGTVFGLQSMSKRSEADELCPDPNRCPVSQRDKVEGLDDDARKAQTLATIGFIAGGVGVAAGVTLFLLSGKKQDQTALQRGPTIHPWLGLGSAGVTGTF